MRDARGRFIHGHTPITERDPKTGKFVKKPHGYKSVEEEVDTLLAKLEEGMG